MAYRIGIDAGSKTLKVIVLDERGGVVFSVYKRHRANIRETLRQAIHDLVWREGDLEATVAITGSGGMQIAQQLGVPFVQEVIATTHAVQSMYPKADVIVELGGEDSKIIYLTEGLEQRMNATCAGGTGSFIDTVAFMLGVSSKGMSSLALGSQRICPIASRCAVFAQTDVRQLLNEGVSKADIAAGTYDAVVRQTLGGLACGRPIHGMVVFLGGPLEYSPYLVYRFRKTLELTKYTGIKPRDAHTFTARGAALLSLGLNTQDGVARTLRLSWLEGKLSTMKALGGDLEHLSPLFENADELASFQARHALVGMPRKRLFETAGPLYVGIDAGSTTVKLAVLDAERNLVYAAYEPTGGDTLATLRTMLLAFYAAFPRPLKHDGRTPQAWVARATATGYGEDMLRAACGIDSGVVETAAHVRAALHLCPQASFVMDIGGQDMKALWVKDGNVYDAVLNEACSSGCGAFVEGTAHSLRSNGQHFAEEALRARNPVDLGTKCTVFMTSRVRHAQKIGASLGDIAAGVAYAVVNNALFRIIGSERVASMGEKIVVQGGTFKSDAVLRAFEKVSGQHVVRPEQAHLMGAIGAALTAAEQAEAQLETSDSPHSTLLGADDLANLELQRRTLACTGCANGCPLCVVGFDDAHSYIGGATCDKGFDELQRRAQSATKSGISRRTAPSPGDSTPSPSNPTPPNVVRSQRQLLHAFRDIESAHPRGAVRIGLMNTLELYESTPFWHTLIAALGFSIAVPPQDNGQIQNHTAWQTIPSESVCYAAKISHVRYFGLLDKHVDAVFMPTFQRESHCPVSCTYACALADNLAPGDPALLHPQLASTKPALLADDAASIDALWHAFEPCAARVRAPLDRREVEQALAKAWRAQQDFYDQLEALSNQALDWVAQDENRHAILLAGRPYHVDEVLMHDIDGQLAREGFAVLGMAGLGEKLQAFKHPSEAFPLPGQDAQPIAPSAVNGSSAADGSSAATVSMPADSLATQPAHAWKPAKRLLRAARYVTANPQVDLVCMESFGCGFDAVSVEQVREELQASGRPHTVLKIDDIVDTAHIRIRLRTLAEAIEARKHRTANPQSPQDPSAPHHPADASPTTDSPAGGCGGAADKPIHLLERPLGEKDLAVSRSSCIKDVCFTANVLAARAIRIIRKHPQTPAIALPRVCRDCLVDALPYMVLRATGATPSFVWENAWQWENERGAEVAGTADGVKTAEDALHQPALTPLSAAASCTCTDVPRIGVLGNALLCFEPYMNDHLAERLKGWGCVPVFPDPKNLFADDIRYLDQLKAFADGGVHDVIYLASFGCLKGHVQARGALRDLKRRFPATTITVIDFDPEASALNRENRMLLAVEAARRAKRNR